MAFKQLLIDSLERSCDPFILAIQLIQKNDVDVVEPFGLSI